MGDILDLFLDFERKLIALFRDMIVRPRAVIESIEANDKKYLGAFKFYSLVFSLWIVLVRFTNSWLDLYSDDWMLPARLMEYSASAMEFSLFLAPFIGLVEIFLPIGIINFFVFRKAGFRLVTHLSFATVIGAMVLIYFLPVIYIFSAIEKTATPDGIEFWAAILLGLPVVYTTYLYISIVTRRRWLAGIKGFMVVLVMAVLGIYLLANPFDEYIHKNIFYRKYAQFDIVPNMPANSWHEIVYTGRVHPAAFSQRALGSNAHNFVKHEYGIDSIRFTLFMADKSDTVATPIVTAGYGDSYPAFSVMNVGDRVFVASVNGEQSAMWLIGKNGRFLARSKMQKRFYQPTFIVDGNGSLLVAAKDFDTRMPLIAQCNEQSLEIQNLNPIADHENFTIDRLTPPNNDGNFQMVLQHSPGNRLKEVQWLKGTMNNDSLIIQKQLSLYRNDFAPTLNGSNVLLHNSELVSIDPTRSLIAFQVMTDSTFAFDLTSVDVETGERRWDKTITIPADLAYFAHTLYSKGSLFVLGMATSVFQKGIMTSNTRHPFVLKIDASNGNIKDLYFLPPDSNVLHLDSYLTHFSMAYQDVDNIYWNIDGQRTLVINKDAL